MSIKVLVVKATGECETQNIQPDLYDLQEIVGGPIEGVYGDGWAAYCNEEGKLLNLPYNAVATELAGSFGWQAASDDVLVGDVVFFGPGDEEGNETDVPQFLVDLAHHYSNIYRAVRRYDENQQPRS